MEQTHSKFLRFVSILLLLAMLTTSQTFSIFAADVAKESEAETEEIVSESTAETAELSTAEETEELDAAAVPALMSLDPDAPTTEFGDDMGDTIVSEDGLLYTHVAQPFQSNINDHESISANTGALEYKDVLVSVANGPTLGISYNSMESGLEHYDYTATKTGIAYRVQYVKVYSDGTVVNGLGLYTSEERAIAKYDSLVDTDTYYYAWAIQDEIDRYRYSQGLVEQTYLEKRYDIGAGWSFDIPSFDVAEEKLILPGIGNFTLDGNEIENYEREDMTLTDDATYSTEQFTSSKKLTMADGRVYYFSEDGLALATLDRFGNSLKYTYTLVDGEYHLSKISDDFNRDITVSYEAAENGRTVTVTAPDGGKTVLHVEDINENGKSVLRKIVYPDNEEVSFEYFIQDGTCNYLNDSADEEMFTQHALLNKVSYGTGMKLNYIYENVECEFGNDGGHTEINRITKRYMTRSDDSDSIFGQIHYEYDGNYIESTKSYTTSVTQVGTNKKTSYTFNTDSLCTTQSIYDGDTIKQRVLNEYDEYDLPCKVVTYSYGTKTMSTTELYVHDKYGNTTKYFPAKSGGDEDDTQYRTLYTYGETYQLPLATSYRQDKSKAIAVSNTLTEDGKSIAYTTVRASGNNVSKTVYTYDSRGRVLTETQCLDLELDTGAQKVYNYNEGNLESVTVKDVADNDGVKTDITTRYTYDAMGRVLTVTDANGNVTSTEYDSRGRVIKSTNPDGSYIEYTYDLANNITLAAHSLLEAAVYDYDPFGYLETTRYANGDLVSESFYDSNGRVIAEATGRGSEAANTVYYEYDVLDRVTEKAVYDADNVQIYRESYTYDDAYLSTTSVATKTVHGDDSAADIVTSIYKNKYGETVKETVGDVVTEYEYDYLSNVTKVYYDSTKLAQYTYDHAGNVLTYTNAASDSSTATYDALGRKLTESDFNGNITTYAYDNAGRLLSMTSPLTDTVSSVIKYYYDANGNVIKQQQTSQADDSTEQIWRTVEYRYDCMNRVTDIISYVDETTAQYTHYRYDAAGNLTDVYTGLSAEWSDEAENAYSSHISYTYDSRGNNTALTDALGMSESYTYDVLGVLTRTTLRDGSSIEYTHSPFGAVGDRVIKNGETVSESTTEYTSTGAVRSVTLDGVTVSYTYDSLGNVLTETEGDTVKAYTYDTRGRKSGYTLTVGGVEKSSAVYAYDKLDRLVSVTEGGITTAYTYDKNGNRASQTTDTVTATYTYNKGNLVTSLVNTISGIETPISSFVYNYYADGNIRTKLETVDGIETAVVYAYDGMGRLISEARGTSWVSYTYDLNGNRSSMTKDGVMTTYVYNENNRLLSESTNGAAVEYAYDNNGNTVAKKYPHSFTDGVCTTCGEAQTYMIGDTNSDGEITLLDVVRVTKIANGDATGSDFSEDVTLLVYDVDGNGVVDTADAEALNSYNLNTRVATAIGTVVENTTECVKDTYTYNARGQQIGYTSSTANASYAYNPSGLRSAKTVGGSTKYFVYNGSQIVYEYDDAGETLYYYGLNRTHNSNGEIYVYNAHGDTVQLVKDGAVTVTYTYDAFGNLISQIGESDNPFKYCGEYFDEETQTYYLRARYYNPANGRFNAEDPHWNAANRTYGDDPFKIYEYQDPLGVNKYTLLPSLDAIAQSGNLYAYCMGNPVRYMDPSGENFWDDAKAFFNNACDYLKKAGEAFVNSLEIEIGTGYGIGASGSGAGVKIKAEAYSDTYTARLDNGEAFMINSGSAGVEIGVVGQDEFSLGVGGSYLHDYHDRYNPCQEHNSLSNPIKVAGCEYADSTPISVTVPLHGDLSSDISKDDVVIGFSASAHVILGGHISFGFNLTEFLEYMGRS